MRCAILDDYQNVALAMADWTALAGRIDLAVFNAHFVDEDACAEAIRDCEIVVVMRERTPFTASLLSRLPRLRLLATTGRMNAAIDLEEAAARGIVVCGTRAALHTTAEMTWALILALARHVPREDANLRAGGPWQVGIGVDLHGKTLGLLGLGTLGSQMARVGLAFGMRVIAWSSNLTAERCAECGVALVSKDALIAEADFLSIHTRLSERTRGLIGAAELRRMKRSAFLVNTSRGFIVDEAALIEALEAGLIAGAGLDVYEREPLPPDHPLRRSRNTVLTPHLGYVTEQSYRIFFEDVVADIEAWLAGSPIRVLTPSGMT